MTTKELTEEAISLPLEDRIRLVDALLQSLNPLDEDVDRKWATVACKRRDEVASGAVRTIPAEDVLEHIRREFRL